MQNYEECSNMNATSFITFFTYRLRYNVIRFNKELFAALKLAPGIKKTIIHPSYPECTDLNTLTCRTKSLPLKSAIVLGNLVLPQTNLRKRDLSAFENSSITSQNHCTRGAPISIPLYVATDFSRFRGISGLPQTWRNNKRT